MTDRATLSSGSLLNRYRRRLVLWLTAGVLAAGMVGYGAGLQDAQRRLVAQESDNERLLREVSELRDRNYQARLELARLESEVAVDSQALNEARSTIAGLEQRNAALESDLGFYRSIMAPSETEKGFRVDSFRLNSAPESGVYHYSLMVTQVGNNDRFLSGRIRITFSGASEVSPDEPGGSDSGEHPDSADTLALHELADNVEKDGIEYRFRYFQAIDGRLKLPEGFTPAQVRMQVTARSRGEKLLDRSWRWSELLAAGQSNS
ncbi:MAG: hypothetical protein HLX50_20560 [Alteromonadaceae bacterium]|nr:hypothetical protein [Alteromonadaceae bacterium]